MPKISSSSQVQEFTLDYGADFDDTEAFVVRVAAATSGDVEILQSKMPSQTITYYDDDDQKASIEQNTNLLTLRRHAVSLCLRGTNIIVDDIELKFNAKGRVESMAQFNSWWNSLPPVLANEIVNKVITINKPVWNFLGEVK